MQENLLNLETPVTAPAAQVSDATRVTRRENSKKSGRNSVVLHPFRPTTSNDPDHCFCRTEWMHSTTILIIHNSHCRGYNNNNNHNNNNNGYNNNDDDNNGRNNHDNDHNDSDDKDYNNNDFMQVKS